ncbi:MAG: hypothetical protein ACR2M0_07350 [Chloroflexia bacterium]
MGLDRYTSSIQRHNLSDEPKQASGQDLPCGITAQEASHIS